MKFCEQCGIRLPEEAAFCPACGARVTPPGETAPQAGPGTPPPGWPGQPAAQDPWQAAPAGVEPWQRPSYQAPQSTARRPQTGLTALGVILLLLGAALLVIWLAGIAAVNALYAAPGAICSLILGVMFLALSRVPRGERVAGMGRGAFAVMCVVLAVAVPAALFAARLLPGSALLGVWIPEGYDRSDRYTASIEFTPDSRFVVCAGSEQITGTWSYAGGELVLKLDLLSALTAADGPSSITLAAEAGSGVLQLYHPDDTAPAILYRFS